MTYQKLIRLIVILAPLTLGTLAGAQEAIPKFADDVLTHVVLHEMGHALIREFDLPVLGNEETVADAFATHFVIKHLPHRAVDVISARVNSLLIEAAEVPKNEWTVRGEHNSDARRAYQITALAVAGDRDKFASLAKRIGMDDDDMDAAADYGNEIHRSWRRILKPLRMPEGQASNEVAIRFDPGLGDTADQIRKLKCYSDINLSLKSFDWHSTVRVFFAQGDGGAGWSRSRRTITVYDQYLLRFVRQSQQISLVKKALPLP
ncbi:MAG: DUF4344 domain-containing metallopeptidase, partial [Planctomycetota bacterium]